MSWTAFPSKRVALVTGGAGPLFGSSISEALVEAGATLITAPRSLENNKAYAEKLGQQGFNAHGMELDITDLESINRLHRQVIEQFGRLDILVNSAFVQCAGSFETETPEDWLTSAKGDMVGLFAVCKAFIPHMVESAKGSITNVSSIYGVVGNDPFLYEGTALLQPPSL